MLPVSAALTREVCGCNNIYRRSSSRQLALLPPPAPSLGALPVPRRCGAAGVVFGVPRAGQRERCRGRAALPGRAAKRGR